MKQINLVSDGKNINLTGDNTIITSTNFNVDSSGNMSCNNAQMNDTTLHNLTITGNDVIYRPSNASYQQFRVEKPGDSSQYSFIDWYSLRLGYNPNNNAKILLACDGSESYIDVQKGASGAQLTSTGVQTYSQAKRKKDFERLNDALLQIKNTDIYKYHYKEQKEDEKKLIGMVIGKDFNYSSDVTNLDENGEEVSVNLYSMIGISWAAIKELSQKVEELENKLKEKEEK